MVPSFHNADKPTHRRVCSSACCSALPLWRSVFHCARSRTLAACWSRPTGWFAPPGNRTKPISVHGFASRNASAERLALIGRQIVAGRLVIYRNGDEAGIGDYVEQNFHPERHLLSLLRQSGSRTPAKRKPRWHPQMPAGCSCLHLSQLRPATSGRRFRSRSFLIFSGRAARPVPLVPRAGSIAPGFFAARVSLYVQSDGR